MLQAIAHPRLRLGILLHGNKLWLSELWGMTFVVALLSALFTIAGILLINEFRIHKLDRDIAKLKSDKITLSYSLDEWRERRRLADVLTRFAGSHVQGETIDRLAYAVYKSSSQFGYDPLLLLAVIRVESYFNPNARGHYSTGESSGALGLMQLEPQTAMSMAKTLDMKITQSDLMHPEVNMVLGVAYLTHLITGFKSFKLALIAYNEGPEAVRASLYIGEPPPLDYYRRVLSSYYQLKSIANKR